MRVQMPSSGSASGPVQTLSFGCRVCSYLMNGACQAAITRRATAPSGPAPAGFLPERRARSGSARPGVPRHPPALESALLGLPVNGRSLLCVTGTEHVRILAGLRGARTGLLSFGGCGTAPPPDPGLCPGPVQDRCARLRCRVSCPLRHASA